MTPDAVDSPLPRLDILIVDDEPRIRSTLGMCLRDDGHRVEAVSNAREAERAADRGAFDVAFVDLRLPDGDGLDLIPALLERLPWLKVIVITAHASIESAVEAMRRGASDYLPKPFSTAEVRLAARKAAELRELEHRVSALEEERESGRPALLLDSRSPAMRRAVATAREVADTDATVLLRGETGTGKGVLARAIHDWSPRSTRPFGVAHCPSFPAELLESELFGHVKGAFTGAVRSNAGRVVRCDGGTLLLDEVGELPGPLQPKLLRFVQSREYERVGDPDTRRADVRILAATNRDLEAAVEDGRFREDLYYRLKVIEIELPPLRERREDILPLAEQFLRFYARKHGREATGFREEARERLMAHAWPGNVRELENVVERAAILCRSGEVGPAHLPLEDTERAVAGVGEDVTLAELEEEHIRRVVARAETLERAAQILGIDTTTLWRRRREYEI
ncbi:MAG: sigma-54 dependent transcriptional regulator [Candidatus Palauibacterales bacterium]|nr:sigma-54 dependent transcriptional regulator [Candidatus Palauibacterales bacterium]